MENLEILGIENLSMQELLNTDGGTQKSYDIGKEVGQNLSGVVTVIGLILAFIK